MGVQHTGKNIPKQFSKSYLLIFSDELNILADAMENHIGLSYATHLIKCHFQHKGFNAACKSTVNLAFLRSQPKRIKIQKIQQGTNNEGKRKEARRHQTKQWLIIINIIPEGKE